MKRILYTSIAVGLLTATAEAKDLSLTAGYNFTDYSGVHGTRHISSVEIKNKLESGAAVFNISQGKRDYGQGESWDALQGRGTLWYNWNPWLSSKTGIAIAENTPVFSRKDLQQDISLKLIPQTLLTFGYRYANYFDDTNMNAWSGGFSLYTGPFITSWRYTYYDTVGIGSSYSNIISLRLNDSNGSGNTQLWLSKGTGAYAYEWDPETRKGKLKSISLRRVQSLTKQLSLGLTVGKQWYDTPVDNYHSLQGVADITWTF